MVLGLLIAAASSLFYTKNQEVILIAADVIRVDRLLRRYGPEAEGLRDLLRRYTAMKIQYLFAEGTTKLPSLENPRTVALLEELQDRLVAFDASNPNQRWLQSQALQLVSGMTGARWLLAEQNTIGIEVPLSSNGGSIFSARLLGLPLNQNGTGSRCRPLGVPQRRGNSRPIAGSCDSSSVLIPRLSYLKSNSSVCLPGERVPGHCLRLHLRSAIALWCHSTSVRKVAVFGATRSLETNQSACPPLAPPDGAALAIRAVFVLL